MSGDTITLPPRGEDDTSSDVLVEVVTKGVQYMWDTAKGVQYTPDTDSPPALPSDAMELGDHQTQGGSELYRKVLATAAERLFALTDHEISEIQKATDDGVPARGTSALPPTRMADVDDDDMPPLVDTIVSPTEETRDDQPSGTPASSTTEEELRAFVRTSNLVVGGVKLSETLDADRLSAYDMEMLAELKKIADSQKGAPLFVVAPGDLHGHPTRRLGRDGGDDAPKKRSATWISMKELFPRPDAQVPLRARAYRDGDDCMPIVEEDDGYQTDTMGTGGIPLRRSDDGSATSPKRGRSVDAADNEPEPVRPRQRKHARFPKTTDTLLSHEVEYWMQAPFPRLTALDTLREQFTPWIKRDVAAIEAQIRDKITAGELVSTVIYTPAKTAPPLVRAGVVTMLSMQYQASAWTYYCDGEGEARHMGRGDTDSPHVPWRQIVSFHFDLF